MLPSLEEYRHAVEVDGHLMPQYKAAEQNLTQRIKRTQEVWKQTGAGTCHITAQAGPDSGKPELCLRMADQSLQRAKSNGRVPPG